MLLLFKTCFLVLWNTTVLYLILGIFLDPVLVRDKYLITHIYGHFILVIDVLYSCTIKMLLICRIYLLQFFLLISSV